MQLEELLEMWKVDSVIDDNNLDGTTVKCAIMHAKYLELFSISKLQLKREEANLSSMKKDKWLYFNGKMTKEQMDEKGWPYDPFDGMSKPMKSDLEMYFETDKDIRKIKDIIEYKRGIVEVLEEIMGTIRWRHQNIKNILEWKKFVAGC